MSREEHGVIAEGRACLALAAPLVAAQLASVAMAVTDTIFMGRLGVEAVAAGGLGVTTFSAVVVAAGGMLTPVSPLVAQAHAQRNNDDVRATVRAGFVVALGATLAGVMVIALMSALLPRLGQPSATLAPATRFLLAIAPTLPAMLAFHVLRHALVAALRPRVVLWVTLLGVVLNAVFDYVLGFGALGAPRLGLAGLGLATSLASWTMLGAAALCAIRSGLLRRGSVEWTRIARILRLGAPVAMMFSLESALFAVATFAVGRYGIGALAAHQIVLQTTYAAYMVPQGLSQAAAVRVARASASGEPGAVRRAAWTPVALGVSFMGLAASAYVVSPGLLASIFIRSAVDERFTAQIASLFAVAAVCQVFDGAQVVAAGALRGLHDTSAPMRVTLVAYGCFGIPSALVLGRFFGAAGAWWGIVVGLGLGGSALLVRLHGRTRAMP
jgi:MATE family multidrug resistance protein